LQGGDGEVSWYFPERAEDNRTLEVWCPTVGPPVIDPIPSRTFEPLAPGDSLIVAVWNTDAGAGDLLALIRDELGLDCKAPVTRNTLPAVATPHFVLLLQESLRRSNDIPLSPPSWTIPPPVLENERPTERLDVVEVARRCGLALAFVPAARNGLEARDGLREEKGNAVLSTLRLSDVIAIELPYEAARRVVVAASIRGPGGGALRLATAHLISMSTPWRILTTGNSSRLREALALIDGLRVVEGDRRPISTIVAGDLNTWSTRETALRHLLDHFPDSPPLMTEPTRGPFPTDHILFRTAPDTGARPDEILAGSYRRIDDSYFSDHHPILASFRFGSRAPY
jgi:endonuclease/exonuclease/phosphatase family metal-dependent hydrolase